MHLLKREDLGHQHHSLRKSHIQGLTFTWNVVDLNNYSNGGTLGKQKASYAILFAFLCGDRIATLQISQMIVNLHFLL